MEEKQHVYSSSFTEQKDTYFGRTLDYEFSYGDEVTITPRNYPLKFRHIEPLRKIMRSLEWRM